MNYSRHFSSEVGAGTAEAHYYLNKDGTASSTTFASASSIVKEQVLGAAFERTLKDCGLANCKYYGMVDDKPVSYFCLDDTADGKPGFYIYVAASYIYFYMGYCATASDTVITHSSAVTATSGYLGARVNITPFSTNTLAANTFDTYIKVVGDTASTFYIGFTTYGTTTLNAITTISVSNMIDKRNNKEVIGFYFGTTGLGAFSPIYKENLVNAATEATVPISTGAASNYVVSSYTPQNNYLMLINNFMPLYPHLWSIDCYLKPSTFTDGNFYEIDGDIYYCATNSIYKCTTSVIPG